MSIQPAANPIPLSGSIPLPELAPMAEPVPHKRRVPGLINAKYLEEIGIARRCITACRLPERIEALIGRLWNPERVALLEQKAAELESAAQRVVGRAKARLLDTEEQEAARAAMLAAISPIRIAAKRQYRGEKEAGRAGYFIGEPTGVSLERLLFIAGELLRKLVPEPGASAPEEVLASVTEADLALLVRTRREFLASETDQNAGQAGSAEARKLLNDLFEEVRALRIDLQLAADQAFPHTASNGANNLHRGAFEIPLDRPAAE